MMEKYNLIICCLMLLMAVSCTKNDTIDIVEQEDISSLNAPDRAWNEVEIFIEKLYGSAARGNDSHELKIVKVDKTVIPMVFSENIQYPLKTAKFGMEDSVELYTYTFMKGNEQGFAIATGDERIASVLAYVENADISDTINNPAAAYIIRNFRRVIVADLNRYYKQTVASPLVSRKIYQNWQFTETVTTKWSTHNAPYNDSYKTPSGGNCTKTSNGKYPASPVAVALAQCYACYPSDPVMGVELPTSFTSKYDVRSFAKTPTITTNSPYAKKVSQYIKEFDNDNLTHFSCSGTVTYLNNAKVELNKIGITDGYYRYCPTNTKRARFVEYIVKALRFGCPTVVGGQDESLKKYLAWIVDGLVGAVAEDFSEYDPDLLVHCNFSFGGELDGWYKHFENPEDYDGNYALGDDYSFFMESIHLRPDSPYFDPQY